jgi:tape measure domain-containing protein
MRTIRIENDRQLAVWSNVQRSVNAAAETMSKMGVSVGSLRERIGALRAQKEWIPASNREAIRATNHEIADLERTMNRLNNLDGGAFKGWFNDIKSAIPGFVNPLTAIIAGIGQTIRSGMASEMQKSNLETLFLGDVNAASEMYSRISDYAIKSPYDTAGLIEGQTMMMQFGVSAEESFDMLGKIGDVAMGNKGKMQQLTLAFSQMSSVGKLLGNDFRQMATAGFNPLEEISKKTGESVASLMERMSRGEISAAAVAEAFRTATSSGFDPLRAVAEKTGESIEQLTSRIAGGRVSVAELTETFRTAASAGIDPIGAVAKKTGESIEQLTSRIAGGRVSVEELTEAFSTAYSEQGRFFQGAERGNQTLQGKLNSLMESLTLLATKVYDKVFAPILKPIVDFANNVLMGAYDMFRNFFGMLREGSPAAMIFAGAIASITAALAAYNIWQMLVANWTRIVTFLKSGEAAAWWAASLPMLATVGIIAAIIAAVAALTAAIVWLVKHVSGWGTLWDGTVSFMKNSLMIFVSSAELYFNTLVNGLMTGLDKIRLGWYKFKEAVGIGDSDANRAAITQINADIMERQQKILDSARKVADYTNAAIHSFDNVKLTTDGTSLGEFMNPFKQKIPALGGANMALSEAVNAPMNARNSVLAPAGGESSANRNIATGGARNTQVTINLGKFFENMILNGGARVDGEETERRFAEMMNRVLLMATN